MANYSYPIDEEWSHEEMATVITFFNLVEEANETGVETTRFMDGYKQFKQVVKSIGEEKRIGREFEQVSGYSLYRTLQEAKKTPNKRFRLN